MDQQYEIVYGTLTNTSRSSTIGLPASTSEGSRNLVALDQELLASD